ncbi:Hsp20/alpha crystallin family protein [Noviherbaspirillum aerium]|uniref:Hsp20/alpha crystallin family protein n=1 Tax=Noviherbaspirillum aerium TaxID=2588497 RepID=UPI00124EE102|nr:Hsp20/alpha crystallin family protein [Noviherbaspirillum aerium]
MSTGVRIPVETPSKSIYSSSLQVNVERGVLTVSGQRKGDLFTKDEKAIVHLNERFAGQFKRIISLSDDLDPDKVNAKYRDGVLRFSIKRKKSAQPQRISVY